MFVTDPVVFTNLVRINILAAAVRVPTMHSRREYVEAGGLMSYGVNFTDLFRRAGDYVDKILRGAKPAEIPVEQGFVLTAVGQNSLPLSIAIRSLRQNASSCSRRRAIASALPSSPYQTTRASHPFAHPRRNGMPHV